MKDSEILFYKNPAEAWTEAIPLGNGKLGAMIFGGTEGEKLSLNYDELWSGFPQNYDDMCAHEAFLQAREFALSGNYKDAESILGQKFQGLYGEVYMPLCDIIINTSNGTIKNYSRILDLETALHRVSYEKDGVHFEREMFVSAPGKVLVMKWTSTKGADFSVDFKSPLKFDTYSRDGFFIIDGRCPSYSYRNKELLGKDYIEYPDVGSLKGIHWRGALKVTSNGIVDYGEKGIHVKNSTYALLIFGCESSFNGFDNHPYLEGKEYKNAALDIVKAASSKSYETLKAFHVNDYAGFYTRVKIDLGTDNKGDTPTDERLQEFNSGKSDKGLWALLFNYGRYLTIAGSRDGSEAMNLQGIWNDSLTPRWSSNYTVNINTQMNYYPTLMIDLPEMTQPLIKLIRDISVTGEATARKLYHAGGFVCHHNTDLWRHTTPIPGKILWSFWNMASGWLCRHLYDYYAYTLDTEFLRNTAYPIMKKAAVFYLDMLTDDGNGSLIISPSTSPENGFITEHGVCGVSKTTTMSMSIIKDLFVNVTKCAKILGLSDDVTDRIKAVTPQLLPFKTGRNGALLEWYDEEKEADAHHIHISHLYALHPAKLITDDTPLLQAAAKETLKNRGDEGAGWSLSWKINFWARLKDGNHALKLLNMQLRPFWRRSSGGGTYQNMFNAHPPFQIDGNFGATSGICEMLLQSDEKTIELLPALPDEWRDGKIEGIRAMNNIKASIEWKNGTLVHYKLTGDTENIKVKYKNRVLQ